MSAYGSNSTEREQTVTRTIIFNQSVPNPEVVNSNNPFPNTIVLRFPIAQKLVRSEAALASLYLYYSWYNITAQFGNNRISFTWPLNGSTTTVNLVIPDGFYQIDDLNDYLQNYLLQNGYYLLFYPSGTVGTGAAEQISYLSFTANNIYYRTTIVSTVMPNSTTGPAAGYAAPTNYAGGLGPSAWDAASAQPLLVIPATPYPAGDVTADGPVYSMSISLGILPGSYPSSVSFGSNFSFNGQVAPGIESTNVVNVGLSCVTNWAVSENPNIIYSFSPNVPFGSQIEVLPPYPIFLPVSDAQYQALVLRLYDENLIPLNMQDANITSTIIIRSH